MCCSVVTVTDICGVNTVPLVRLMRFGVTLNTFDMVKKIDVLLKYLYGYLCAGLGIGQGMVMILEQKTTMSGDGVKMVVG